MSDPKHTDREAQILRELLELAEGWRLTAARIETRPDAKLSPSLVSHLTTCLENRAEEIDDLVQKYTTIKTSA